MVCFQIDEYINDRDKTHWFVDLSDGTRVFGDDFRYGPDDRAWKRLRTYLYENSLYITKLWIRFRSHIELMGSSDIGYMFRNGVIASVATGENRERFVVGLIKDNKVHVQVWNVPEIQKCEDETEEREIESCSESIIWNSLTEKENLVVPLTI